jgi:hypothetical protein
MGFTDCQFFNNTTVPAFDDQSPSRVDAVWSNGNYLQIAVNTDTLLYDLPLGTSVVAVSAAIDNGGVRELETVFNEQKECCILGSISCITYQLRSGSTVLLQDGSVGSTVSDGIWTGSLVTAPDCDPGFTLQWYRFAWWTIAEDFAGNTTLGGLSSIQYGSFL